MLAVLELSGRKLRRTLGKIMDIHLGADDQTPDIDQTPIPTGEESPHT